MHRRVRDYSRLDVLHIRLLLRMVASRCDIAWFQGGVIVIAVGFRFNLSMIERGGERLKCLGLKTLVDTRQSVRKQVRNGGLI